MIIEDRKESKEKERKGREKNEKKLIAKRKGNYV